MPAKGTWELSDVSKQASNCEATKDLLAYTFVNRCSIFVSYKLRNYLSAYISFYSVLHRHHSFGYSQISLRVYSE